MKRLRAHGSRRRAHGARLRPLHREQRATARLAARRGRTAARLLAVLLLAVACRGDVDAAGRGGQSVREPAVAGQFYPADARDAERDARRGPQGRRAARARGAHRNRRAARRLRLFRPDRCGRVAPGISAPVRHDRDSGREPHGRGVWPRRCVSGERHQDAPRRGEGGPGTLGRPDQGRLRLRGRRRHARRRTLPRSTDPVRPAPLPHRLGRRRDRGERRRGGDHAARPNAQPPPGRPARADCGQLRPVALPVLEGRRLGRPQDARGDGQPGSEPPQVRGLRFPARSTQSRDVRVRRGSGHGGDGGGSRRLAPRGAAW